MPEFLVALFTGIHILACIALMVTILLQSGKGGGLAGAFGGGSSQTLFGGRGAATFLSRASTVLAVIFFVTSLTLGLAASRRTTVARGSLIQEEARKRAAQRPADSQAPGAPAAGQQGMPSGAPAGQTAGGLGSAPSAPQTTPSQPSQPSQTQPSQTTTPPASGTSGK